MLGKPLQRHFAKPRPLYVGPNLKTKQSRVILDSRLKKTRVGKSHAYREVIAFKDLRQKADVFKLPRFKALFLWRISVDSVGLTVEIKLRFQIFLALYEFWSILLAHFTELNVSHIWGIRE